MRTIHNHPATKKAGAALFSCLLTLLMLFCSLPSRADNQESIKKKEYNKSFNAGKSDNVYIDNRFGSITVTYWSKNEVSIRVVVEAKARNEQRAQAHIDRVSVNMEKSGNTISAVTSLKEQSGNGSNESFSIKYFVNMPAGISSDLNQKYGNISMPEENKGNCSLHVKYGNINGGNFSAPLDIEAQYGNVEINDVANASLDLSYCGKAVLSNASNLEIDSRYSNLEIRKVKNINLDIKYGNVDILSLDKGTMDIKYSQADIRYLKDELNVDGLSYSTLNILDVSPNFKSIYADSHYGNLKIDIPSNASFKVSAEGMKYGDYDIRGFNVTRSNIEDKTDHKTEVNGGRGGYIEYEGNSYGNLKIRTK